MKHSKPIVFLSCTMLFLFSSLYLTQQSPVARAALSPQWIICDAPGTSDPQYGETDQVVRFEALYTGLPSENIYEAWFNYHYDGDSYNEIKLTSEFSGKSVWYYFIIQNTGGSNITGHFNFSCRLFAGGRVDTNDINITIAPACTPKDVQTVTATPLAGGAIKIDWQMTVGAWNPSYNGPIKNITIYRKPWTGGLIVVPDGQATVVGSTNMDATTFTDTGAPEGTAYRYAVTVWNYGGRHSNVLNIGSQVSSDATPPAFSACVVNDTNVLDGKVMTLYRGGFYRFSITPSEDLKSLGAKISFQAIIDGSLQSFEVNMIHNSTGTNYYYDLETVPAFGDPMAYGTYDFSISMTDTVGNVKTQNFVGQLIVAPPPDPTLMIILIVAAIAAGGAVGGYVVVKKIKGKREEIPAGKGSASAKRQRKGEIYRGASALGRASGDEAEEILAKRQREASSAKPEKVKREREERPKASGSLSDSALASSSVASSQVTDKFDTISTRASVKEIKAAERGVTVDPAKKSDFLQGRITNLDNIMSIIVGLVEMVPEAAACEKCGRPLASGWQGCPWCRVAAQNDELDLKMSISGMDTKRHNVCPNCRSPLDPTWSRCPYCATRNV